MSDDSSWVGILKTISSKRGDKGSESIYDINNHL